MGFIFEGANICLTRQKSCTASRKPLDVYSPGKLAILSRQIVTLLSAEVLPVAVVFHDSQFHYLIIGQK